MRCVHEAKMWPTNCFVTLTYSPENVPLVLKKRHRDVVLFLKRLRSRNKDREIRYFGCGEYGSVCVQHSVRDCRQCRFGRPHYHLILFNCDFPDKKVFHSDGENTLYTSEILDSCWKLGHASVGSMTFESAAYVSRYCVKKVTGEKSAEHYKILDELSGEIVAVTPEHSLMSRRPGIGKRYYEKYGRDIYPSDSVVVRGFPSKPPRYYDELFKEENPEGFEEVKRRREEMCTEYSPHREYQRETCTLARVDLLRRSLK